jgi:phosphoribosylamine--glycine ligase
MSRKILVIGNGGREHALSWALLKSPSVELVVCVPGNGGTELLPGCENRSLSVDDFASIVSLIRQENIDFVVVGPELPLSLGIVDTLRKEGILVFGPNQEGAKIESSKAWAKDLFQSAGIPTAESATFNDLTSAQSYVNKKGVPIVLKADGLAAGKGVIVAMTLDEAQEALLSLFGQGYTKIIVEEYLVGEEVSVLALTDGKDFRLLLPAQDHKRIGEGNTGLNTGGMGAYCPANILTPELEEQIKNKIFWPTISELQKRGIEYCGVLYAGLMISPDGIAKILEYNCRFGDPETQAILPLLKTPLDELFIACIAKELKEFPPLEWHEYTSVCVIAASGGYPESYEKGKIITGVDSQDDDILVFQAGTRLENDDLLTDGGRVLGVTAIGSDFGVARKKAYEKINQIHFEGMYFRRDIANNQEKRPK